MTSVGAFHRSKAFTIIELLVVVSLIVLLVALMMPSLSRARETTRATICRSNERQLGVAMKTYTATTGFYPGAHTWTSCGHAGTWIIWPSRLRVYTGPEPKVFWCPDAEPESQWSMLQINAGLNLPAEFGYEKNEVRLAPNTKFSYGYNNWGASDFAVPQRGLGGLAGHPNAVNSNCRAWAELPVGRVQAPSRMYAIGDSGINGSWDAFIDSDQPPEYPEPRHFNQVMMLMCDGHVEPVDLVDMVGGGPEMARWNNDNKP